MLNILKNKIFIKILIFSIVFFGLLTIIFNVLDENKKFYNFQNNSTLKTPRSDVDSITVGESKEFDVYNGSSDLTFHVKYDFLQRIDHLDVGEIEYHVNVTITNLINTTSTSNLYYQIIDANTSDIYIDEENAFSLAFNEEWSKEYQFSVPDDAHLKMRVGVQYSLSPYYSDYIYLLSFDRPTITNLKVEKDISSPEKVNIVWKYQGDPSIIIPEKTYINGTGIGTNILFDPTSEKFEVDNLSSNTLYDDWSVTIAYESGFDDEVGGKIVEQSLPSFYTFFENVVDVPTFSYANITSSSFTVEVDFSGILTDTITYTNLYFKSDSASIDKSQDIDVDSDQQLTFDFTVNSSQKINDLNVDITLEDNLFNTTTYNLPLPEIQIPSKEITIDNFEIVDGSIEQNSIKINWTIIDDDNIKTKIYLYDNISGSEIIELNSLSASDYEINNFNSNNNYSLVLKVDWLDPITNDSGTKESSPIEFNTSYNLPKIIDFSLKDHTNNSATLNIKYEDADDIVDTLIIHDNNNNFADITLEPNDINPLTHTYKLNNLSLGSYELVLSINWISLDDSGTIESSSISFEIFDVPEILKFEVESFQSKIIVNWEIEDTSFLVDDVEVNLSDGQKESYDLSGNVNPTISQTTIFDNLEFNTNYQASIIINYTHEGVPDSSTTIKEITTKDVPAPIINTFNYEIKDSKIILRWNIEYDSNLVILSSIKIYDSQNELILQTNDSEGELELNGEDYPGTNEFNLVVNWEDLEGNTSDDWMINKKTTVIYNPSTKNIKLYFIIIFTILALLAIIISIIIIYIKNKKVKKEIINIG